MSATVDGVRYNCSNILVVNGIITIDGVTIYSQPPYPPILKLYRDAGVDGKGSITIYDIVNGSITTDGSRMKIITDDVILIVVEANGQETSWKVPMEVLLEDDMDIMQPDFLRNICHQNNIVDV